MGATWRLERPQPPFSQFHLACLRASVLRVWGLWLAQIWKETVPLGPGAAHAAAIRQQSVPLHLCLRSLEGC